ncbi:hypothetical protein CVT26_004444 [Gymnopilus dilepis]|uniref:Uncharacterized protein n=1 Tax=Gymnopilus dilepis TaxID=231916 RepID=A0A409W6S5_9AGAR|nr:hypothetical protein CVT26_004444 [Gymnopilus dilepis]
MALGTAMWALMVSQMGRRGILAREYGGGIVNEASFAREQWAAVETNPSAWSRIGSTRHDPQILGH